MSAHILLTTNITPGREDDARSVLRDYSAYLEGFGAQATVYRTLIGGENTGRVFVYQAS
jgi:hypothetical protein